MPREMEWDEFYVQFQAGLTLVTTHALRIAAPVVYRALARIQEVLSVIPPQPARDRAKTFNTYVRNIGSFPKSAFVQTNEGWKRKRTGAYDKGKIRYTSQQSSKRWGIYVDETGNTIIGTLRNDATYSGWIWGPKDQSLDPHQVEWHTETGWVSQDDAIRETKPDVDQMLQQAVDEILAVLMRGS